MAKKVQKPGDIVRYVPAPEPLWAAFAIFVLTLVEVAFIGLFVYGFSDPANLLPDGEEPTIVNNVQRQQFLAFCLGSAILTMAAILSIYRKFFVPDVLVLKERKPKYEDLM